MDCGSSSWTHSDSPRGLIAFTLLYCLLLHTFGAPIFAQHRLSCVLFSNFDLVDIFISHALWSCFPFFIATFHNATILFGLLMGSVEIVLIFHQTSDAFDHLYYLLNNSFLADKR